MINKPFPPNHPKMLLTSREAAELLSISERTLWTLTKAGSIAVVKIGGSKRYAISDLERFIANQTHHETDLATNNSAQSRPKKHPN
jgi:excisionase family DNA binding protein